jgi:hypothetical protein
MRYQSSLVKKDYYANLKAVNVHDTGIGDFSAAILRNTVVGDTKKVHGPLIDRLKEKIKQANEIR